MGACTKDMIRKISKVFVRHFFGYIFNKWHDIHWIVKIAVQNKEITMVNQ